MTGSVNSATKTVAVIGATIHGNHGAEAMLEATIGRIREQNENTRFLVYSYYAARDRQLNARADVEYHSATPVALVTTLFPFGLLLAVLKLFGLKSLGKFFPSSVAALAEADLLVDLAGVSYIDGREKFLPFNILTILPAMMLGVPVVKFSQAMGPFKNPINRLAAKIMLRWCTKVFARGAITAGNLTELAGKVDWERADDIAFLFAGEDTLTEQGIAVEQRIRSEVKSRKDKGQEVIGICPSSVVAEKGGEAYLDQMKVLIEHLTAQNKAVLLFPNATRVDRMDKLFNNDLPILKTISESLSPEATEQVILIQEDLYAREIKNIIADCSIVIVSRFHAMVLALAEKVPPLVIGWSHKYVEVMALFDLEENVADYEAVGDDSLNRAVDQALVNRAQMYEKIDAKLPSVIATAQVQVDYASALLKQLDEDLVDAKKIS